MKYHTLIVLTSALALSPVPSFGASPSACPDTSSIKANTIPGEYEDPSKAAPQGLSSEAQSIWTQSTLTGDWGGLRTSLENRGITIEPTYTGEVFGNLSGGIKTGAIYDGLINLCLGVDLAKLTGLEAAGTIHANFLYIHGPSLSSEDVGDFSNTSNIAGYNSPKLQELWYQQQFWQQRITLKVGLIAADTEFFTSAYSALFLNGTLGAFTFVGANLPNAPVYPIAAPGIRLYIQPVSKFYLQAGIFAGDPGDPVSNPYGLDWRIKRNDGALVLLETGFMLNQSPGDRGLQGTYKLGAFLHTGEFDTWQSQANHALTGSPLTNESPNYGVYAILDQEIYKSGGLAVSGFVRGGLAPSNVNFVDRYLDCGINCTGLLPSRPEDVFGVAFARSWISGEYSRADQAQGNGASGAESVIEATYKVPVTPWCSVQPDFQYIIDPGGYKGTPDAVVAGCRFNIIF
ncbi:MAG: carbohydrate porin [Chthoniobacteraceae bacterium]